MDAASASLPIVLANLLHARVPWDDRRALQGSLADLRELTVREHLHEIGSGLSAESAKNSSPTWRGTSWSLTRMVIPMRR